MAEFAYRLCVFNSLGCKEKRYAELQALQPKKLA